MNEMNKSTSDETRQCISENVNANTTVSKSYWKRDMYYQGQSKKAFLGFKADLYIMAFLSLFGQWLVSLSDVSVL